MRASRFLLGYGDECLVANPDRPRLGILPPPSARYRDLDKCCRVDSQPFPLQPLVRCIPFIAVKLDQRAEPLRSFATSQL